MARYAIYPPPPDAIADNTEPCTATAWLSDAHEALTPTTVLDTKVREREPTIEEVVVTLRNGDLTWL